MTGKKHLNLEDRLKIQNMLDSGCSLSQIAKELGRCVSSVSREIKIRAIPLDKFAYGRAKNRCIHRSACTRSALCYPCKNPRPHHCRYCSRCNENCNDFLEEHCERLNKPPYVCNACASRNACPLMKRIYSYKAAQASYEQTLSESRKGANVTELELELMDQLISPLLLKGHSPYHAISVYKDRFPVSSRSIYRYIHSGILSAKPFHLPRIPRLKPRRSKPIEHKVDRKCRIGRTLQDFSAFLESHEDMPVVQMDSVIGSVGGKSLLTFSFENGFFLAFLRDHNNSFSVVQVFNDLCDRLGVDVFRRLFPLILTDNGSEFSDPSALEFTPAHVRRTRIFYCDPKRSEQKGRIEVAHEMLRRILPKGSSFDSLTQEDIDLIVSHINSYNRKKLNDRSPMDAFSFLYGEDILHKLGLVKVPAVDVVLTPELIS